LVRRWPIPPLRSPRTGCRRGSRMTPERIANPCDTGLCAGRRRQSGIAPSSDVRSFRCRRRSGGERGVAGYAFLTYSRDDGKYVDRLIAHLRDEGLAVWLDDAAHPGEKWRSVQAKIDGCAALIVVMSPAGEQSRSVCEQIDYACDQGKPVLPLLLAGHIPWWLSRFHCEEIEDARMPSSLYVAR